jgi:hypothetical protein
VANQVGVLVRDCGAGAGADAVPDLTDLVSMIGLVADANADYGALGFLTTPLLAATLSRTLVASSAGSEMLWLGRFDEGTIRGYRAIATNQVTKVWNNGATTGGAEHGLLFGNWNECLIALWNAMEAVSIRTARKSLRASRSPRSNWPTWPCVTPCRSSSALTPSRKGMTLTTKNSPPFIGGAGGSGMAENVEKDKKQVTLLSDIKVSEPTDDKPGIIGHRGETHTLKVGLANMLLASNQALDGEVKGIKPFPNLKAEAAAKAAAEAAKK